MKYQKTILLKDGRNCIIRNGTEADGQAAFDSFNKTHGETDFLLSYPDENSMTADEEGKFLAEKTVSEDEIELVAEIAGKIIGMAGFEKVGPKYKTKHRAEFGIFVEKEYWGLGIGRALINACIELSEKAGYTQLELDVVSENERAVSLCKSVGFVEYGRNPRGFNSRISGFQELVLMRRELGGGKQ